MCWGAWVNRLGRTAISFKTSEESRDSKCTTNCPSHEMDFVVCTTFTRFEGTTVTTYQYMYDTSSISK